MPFFHQISKAGFTIYLWKLDETLDELEAHIDHSFTDTTAYQKLKNDVRKKEWLATRLLTKYAIGEWPIIEYNSNGAPQLVNSPFHISISHSKHMVGIVLSDSNRIGIDIENINRKVDSVVARFLSNKELNFVRRSSHKETGILHWCAKEAIFKAAHSEGIEFSTQILIHDIDFDRQTASAVFQNHTSIQNFQLAYEILQNHMVVWTYLP